eukprot:TRINITY_DN5591_c0_g1_i2.p1 TRINITY_DN5591_c0_g1~~TRINITY_DN5591_c0_g1_i2.p1  ORF type:complete len:195 (-),score=62.52 TRINITY_DN5591_c0_g1_i2:263-847(-)
MNSDHHESMGMETQNTNNTTPNPPTKESIPVKKFSPQDVQRLVETLERMDKNDPRYANLLQLLKLQQSVHGHHMSGSTSYKAPTAQQQQQQQQQPANEKGPLKVGFGGITSAQLFQLRAQILAYKYLSRNIALPPKLLLAIKAFSTRAHQHQQAITQQQNMQQHQQQLAQQHLLAQQQNQLLQQTKMVTDFMND